ncbi:MAG TPA: HEAT repeat domain-containing protein [Verrucomicrobiae bacterium]|nr:HEAT repeat domain-containing protein [Verrucomicrobiae bacterium]
MITFRHPLLAIGSLAAVLGAVTAAVHRLEPAEPVYEGFPLGYYLENQTYGDLRREREATEAIRAIGSNAVPPLLRILSQRESQLSGALHDWVRHQRWGRGYPASLATRQRQALLACQALESLAAPAIPALAGLTGDPELAGHAVRALAFAGPQSFSILTNLVVTGLVEARVEAAGDLRCFRGRTDLAPVLLRALKDPHPAVRARAADTLGVLHADAATVVPALTRCLSDDHGGVILSVILGLRLFGAEAAAAGPALLPLRNNLDPTIRDAADQTLHEIGWPAQTGAPPLAPGRREAEAD